MPFIWTIPMRIYPPLLHREAERANIRIAEEEDRGGYLDRIAANFNIMRNPAEIDELFEERILTFLTGLKPNSFKSLTSKETEDWLERHAIYKRWFIFTFRKGRYKCL